MFTHTSHCFSGCEEAHNNPINGGLSGMEKRLKAGRMIRHRYTEQRTEMLCFLGFFLQV